MSYEFLKKDVDPEEFKEFLEKDLDLLFDYYSTDIKENDFVLFSGVPINDEVQEFLHDGFKERGILVEKSDKIEHVQYPYKGNFYYLKMIFCKNEEEARTDNIFCHNPKTLFEKAVHIFANQCGFAIDEYGLYMKIKYKDFTYKYPLISAKDLVGVYKILDLSIDESGIHSSIFKLASWIMESNRYTSYMDFNDLGDNYRGENLLKIFQSIQVSEKIKSGIVDLDSDNFNSLTDLENRFEFEKSVLTKKKYEVLLEFCEDKLSGEPDLDISNKKFFKKMGYKKEIVEEISQEVASHFGEGDSIQEIKNYIRYFWPKTDEEK
ncbi:MAG: hypothetical protein ACOCV1_02530 [Bacillota bacterium]